MNYLEHTRNLESWSQTWNIVKTCKLECNLGNMSMNYLKYIKNLETWKSKHNLTNLSMNYLEHIINLNIKLETWA
jgi:uncharacterized protein YfbU (UPF0304 family)